MILKQITVFIENRKGRLSDVTDVLAKNNINMSAVSLADSADFGILRAIVDDTEKAIKILKENGFLANTTDVVVCEIGNEAGCLNSILQKLTANDISVEYLYCFTYSAGARVVLRVANPEQVSALLD